MRVFGLLYLYRATPGTDRLGLGLKLCREHKLAHKNPPNPAMGMDEWNKIRRVWRLLIFMSCWLSFTMGSLSDQEVEFEKITVRVRRNLSRSLLLTLLAGCIGVRCHAKLRRG